MKKILIFAIFIVIATLSNFADTQYLQIHQNGKITNSIKLDSIDYMEIVEIPEPETPIVVNKRLIKGGESDNQISFEYTEDRITSFSYDDKDIRKIIYSDSLITINSKEKYVLQDGLIKECVDWIGDSYQYEYENGRLISIMQMNKQGEVFKRRDFTWDNGIIIKERNWLYDDEDTDLRLYAEDNFEYYPTEDNGNVITFIQGNSFLFTYVSIPLLLQGYFGELPTKLIKTINSTNYQKPDSYHPDPYYQYSYRYTYVLDDDNYPIYMYQTYDDGRSQPYIYKWKTVD